MKNKRTRPMTKAELEHQRLVAERYIGADKAWDYYFWLKEKYNIK